MLLDNKTKSNENDYFKIFDLLKETLPGRVYSKELIELLFCQPYTKGQLQVFRVDNTEMNRCRPSQCSLLK